VESNWNFEKMGPNDLTDLGYSAYLRLLEVAGKFKAILLVKEQRFRPQNAMELHRQLTLYKQPTTKIFHIGFIGTENDQNPLVLRTKPLSALEFKLENVQNDLEGTSFIDLIGGLERYCKERSSQNIELVLVLDKISELSVAQIKLLLTILELQKPNFGVVIHGLIDMYHLDSDLRCATCSYGDCFDFTISNIADITKVLLELEQEKLKKQ
jgi:hypothetical protein